MRRFAVLLRLERRKRGLSKKEAARNIGLELRTYETLEDGGHEPMSLGLLKAGEYYGLTFTAKDILTQVPRDLIETLFDSFR
jgi:transcriptional regulator with XRE-family HTH domain